MPKQVALAGILGDLSAGSLSLLVNYIQPTRTNLAPNLGAGPAGDAGGLVKESRGLGHGVFRSVGNRPS